MGNEESRSCKFDMEEESLEVTDNWTLHYAKDIDNNVSQYSAFVGEAKGLESNKMLLEKLSKVNNR